VPGVEKQKQFPSLPQFWKEPQVAATHAEVEQAPFTQVVLVGQTLPQEPQLSGSVRVLVQAGPPEDVVDVVGEVGGSVGEVVSVGPLVVMPLKQEQADAYLLGSASHADDAVVGSAVAPGMPRKLAQSALAETVL